MTYLLSRSVGVDEDLIDQLFNANGKRLARMLMRLTHYGQHQKFENGYTETVPTTVGPDDRHHAPAGQLANE